MAAGSDRTNVPDVPPQRGSFSTGCGLGVLVGGPAAFGLVVLVGHAFASCDVGINNTANANFLLYIAFPLLSVVNAVLFSAVFARISARVSGPAWRQRALGVVAALLAVLLLAWLLFAWQGTPSDYPDPICHSNVPPWWPSWIPV